MPSRSVDLIIIRAELLGLSEEDFLMLSAKLLKSWRFSHESPAAPPGVMERVRSHRCNCPNCEAGWLLEDLELL